MSARSLIRRPRTPRAAARRALRSAALACALAAGCGGADDADELQLVLDPTLPELRGSFDLTGEVALPDGLPAGAFVYLGVTRGRPLEFGVSDEQVAGLTRAGLARVRFRLRGLSRGRYAVFAGVDLNRDTRVDESEPGGYFDGTTLAPLRDPASARLVELDPVAAPLSFGIGVPPPGR